MLDDRLEGRLRTALRGAAEELPLTITAAELERRLAARRRQRSGRRLSLVAAAVAVIAVGSMVGIANGWLTLPATSGQTPAPSASASPSPSSTISPLLASLPELVATQPDVTAVSETTSDVDRSEPDVTTPTIHVLAELQRRIAITISCAGPGVALELRVGTTATPGSIDDRAIPCLAKPFTQVYDQARHPGVSTFITLVAPRENAWRALVEYLGPVAPPVVRTPIGRPDDTVIVRSIPASAGPKPSLMVTLVHEDLTRDEIGPFSEDDLADGVIVGGRPPRVSATGYLLVSLTDAEDGDRGAAVYDLHDPLAAPRFYDDPRFVAFAWGPTGLLAADDTHNVFVYDPADPATSPTVIPIAENVALTTMGPYHGISWTADGQGFVADRDVSGEFLRGVLGLDGTFTPDRNIAPFASVGIERLTNLAGQSVGPVCAESSATSDGLCRLIATNADGTTGQVWSPENQPLPADQIWAADASRLWILVTEQHGEATNPTLRIELGGPSTYVEVATAPGPPIPTDGRYVVFAGLTADDSRIAIDLGTGQTLVVNRITGETATIEGTFAGWGDPTGFTYPNPEAP